MKRKEFNRPDDVPFSYHLKWFLVAFFGIPVLLVATAWISPYLFAWMDRVSNLHVGIVLWVIVTLLAIRLVRYL